MFPYTIKRGIVDQHDAVTAQLLQSKIGVPAADSVVQSVIYIAWESAILPQLSMLAAVIIFHSHARSFSITSLVYH